AFEVFGSGSAGRFDLDSDDAAVGVFEDEVDFDAAAVAEVAEGGGSLGPGQLADEFGGGQGFEEGPDGGRARAEEGFGADTLEVGGEGDVGDEEFGAADDFGAEIGGPGGDEADQERCLEAGEVAAHRAGGDVEVGCNSADIEFIAGSSGAQPEKSGHVGEPFQGGQFGDDTLDGGGDVALEPGPAPLRGPPGGFWEPAPAETLEDLGSA